VIAWRGGDGEERSDGVERGVRSDGVERGGDGVERE